jgi:hypothetical protein
LAAPGERARELGVPTPLHTTVVVH